MKNLLSIILVQILFFSLPSWAQNSNALNTMSFNIRYDNPEDGKQNWHHRKENIIRMVNFYDLDIIGI